MLNKVTKRFLKSAAAVVLCLSFMGTGHAFDAMGGSLIPATPFDRQLNTVNNPAPALGRSSSSSLFFLARSIRYIPDARVQDHWQTPDETQMRWAGDCEDKAVWLFAQLKQSGYTGLRLVVGRMHRSDQNFHVWLTLDAGDGELLILDPTAQKKIWKRSDFGLGDYQPIYSFDGQNRYKHS